MKERELAQKLVASAKSSAELGDTDGVECGFSFNAVIVDYENTFGDGKMDFRLVLEECDKLGYDVFPLDRSVVAIFSDYLNGKLVVQSKEYRNGCDNGLYGGKDND